MGEPEVPPVCAHHQEWLTPPQNTYQVRTFYPQLHKSNHVYIRYTGFKEVIKVVALPDKPSVVALMDVDKNHPRRK